MKWYINLNSPSRLGLATSLGAGLAVLVLCGIFEFVMPVRDIPAYSYIGQRSFNFRSVILYAAAGGSHIFLCGFASLFLFLRMKAEEPRPEIKKIRINMALAFSCIVAIVVIASIFNFNVVEQSYRETMRPLQGDQRFGFLLDMYRIPLVNFEFQVFALYPLLLVFFGAAIGVVGCFWVAHRAVDFVRKADDLRRPEILEMKREIAQLIALISIVFTSSTISTIAFLQLGRDWIEQGYWKDAYTQNGYAMSIFWSVCYTVVIFAMILIPLFWVRGKLLRLQRRATHVDRPGFYDQIYEVISYKFVSQTGAAMLMPIFTSSFAAIFGS